MTVSRPVRLISCLLVGGLAACAYASPYGILEDLSPNAAGTGFGESVAVNGGLVLIGAGDDDSFGTLAGSAYLIDPTNGNPTIRISAPISRDNARFGMSAAMNSSLAIVGAGADPVAGFNSGAVYAFDRETGDLAYELNGTVASMAFGWAIAANESLLVVASRMPTMQETGAFVYEVETGRFLGWLPIDDERTSLVPRSVAVSADYIAIGHPSGRVDGETTGAVYLFDTRTFQAQPRILASDFRRSAEFGNAVAIQGDLMLIGSRGWEASLSTQGVGSAYLYRISTGEFLHQFNAPVEQSGGYFGSDVCFSEHGILIGCESPGRVYQYDMATYQLIGEFTDSNRGFGRAIAAEGPLAYVGTGRGGTRDTASIIAVGPTCDGDINRDGRVDLTDLNTMLQKFGSSVPAGLNGDVDGSGVIDLADLNAILMQFGDDCPPVG